MDRISISARRAVLISAAAAFLLAAGSGSAHAQIFSRPFVAAYIGQARTDFSLGDAFQDLDWRRALAVEGGFEIFGMTISPGFTDIDIAEWTTPQSQEVDMQYRAITLNIGTREPNGIYFAGGLNYAFWRRMPSQIIGGVPYLLSASGEVGFQAYLGFQASLTNLPFRILVEAGYAQFNGYVSGTAGGDPIASQVSSTGPIVRFGIALAKPPR